MFPFPIHFDLHSSSLVLTLCRCLKRIVLSAFVLQGWSNRARLLSAARLPWVTRKTEILSLHHCNLPLCKVGDENCNNVVETLQGIKAVILPLLQIFCLTLLRILFGFFIASPH